MTLESQRRVIPVDSRTAVVRHFCEAVEAPQLIVGPGSAGGQVDTVFKQIRLAGLYKREVHSVQLGNEIHCGFGFFMQYIIVYLPDSFII